MTPLECIKEYGPDQVFALYESNGEFKRAIWTLLTMGALGAGMYFHYIKNSPAFTQREKEQIEQRIPNMPRRMNDLKDIIPNFQEKVAAEREFLEWTASRIDTRDTKYSNRLSLDPEYIVLICAYTNYDIMLLNAQLHTESHGGVTDKAYECNNPFSYKLTDDGAKFYFNSQNEAVPVYINLMQKDYLMVGTDNEKTPDNLLRNFVNFRGSRYASDKGYEGTLRCIYYGTVNAGGGQKLKDMNCYQVLKDGVWGSDEANPHSDKYVGRKISMNMPHRDKEGNNTARISYNPRDEFDDMDVQHKDNTKVYNLTSLDKLDFGSDNA